MGHANCKNLSELFIRRIYAKGKISLNEMAKWNVEQLEKAKFSEKAKKKYGFCCSEGIYDDILNISNGYALVIWHHYRNEIIMPILDTKEKEDMINQESNFSEKQSNIFDAIEWKFSKGSRKKYLDKQIKHLYNITE